MLKEGTRSDNGPCRGLCLCKGGGTGVAGKPFRAERGNFISFAEKARDVNPSWGP